MATKRTRYMNSDVHNSKGGHDREPEHGDCISAAHIKLMEEFIGFCKWKRSNQAPADSCNFKEKLDLYYGDQLPGEVINELCAFVSDNLYGKCSYCAMPTESLVLGVLQILADAGFKKCEEVGKYIHVSASKLATPPMYGLDSAGKILQKPMEGSTHASTPIHNGRIDRAATKINEINHPDKNPCIRSSQKDTQIRIEAMGTFDKVMTKVGNNIPILDTPLVMNHNSFYRTEIVSQPDPANPVWKRTKSDSQVHEVIDVGEVQNKFFSSHGNLHQIAKDSSIINVTGVNLNAKGYELGKISDEIYNRKNFPAPQSKENVVITKVRPVGAKPFGGSNCTAQPSPMFHVTDEERRYYDIICGFAHSQWMCLSAVIFGKTTLTYQSLGESVEPSGTVDNFFISCYCRKLFLDEHPRRSKKHYFYTHVGGCLLTYNCKYDVDVVRNSFTGANSAYKLHLSSLLSGMGCKTLVRIHSGFEEQNVCFLGLIIW